jgi:hypothetical protein
MADYVLFASVELERSKLRHYKKQAEGWRRKACLRQAGRHYKVQRRANLSFDPFIPQKTRDGAGCVTIQKFKLADYVLFGSVGKARSKLRQYKRWRSSLPAGAVAKALFRPGDFPRA